MPSKSFMFWVLLGLSSFVVSCAHAQERLLDGTTLAPRALADLVAQVQPGDVVVLGENHGLAACQSEQMHFLRALRARGLRVSVGMEFLEYPQQAWTDQYRAGQLAEDQFLKDIRWSSGLPFSFYRDQILFPEAGEGAATVALNAPRSLTGQVAQGGLGSLSPEQQALLPPGLTRGNARYFERFKDSVGHLPTPEAAERYFWAQSIWDETMAWKALDFVNSHPDQVLAIVVGEFHVQYGGGLPDRLRARGARKVWTLSQVNAYGWTENDLRREAGPSPVDGPRADWIWTFEQP